MTPTLLKLLSKTVTTRLLIKNKKQTAFTLLLDMLTEKKILYPRNFRERYKMTNSSETFGSEVYGVISLKFSRSNTLFSVTTSAGETVFSGSAGSLGLRGKQKTNRQIAVKRIVKLLKEVYPLLLGFAPLSALHVINVGTHRSFIVKIMTQVFLVTSIKSFDLIPYNGCRKKKVRRKKVVPQLPR